MKFLRLALVCAAASLCVLHAQDDDQQQQKPPTEIPDFNNLDEYIYVPKSNLNYGFRYTTGVRAHFGGNSRILAPEATPAGFENPNNARVYHDGAVGPDQRSTIVDNGNGQNATNPVSAADGKTNSWSYTDQSQLTSEGFLQYHIYSDTTTDTGTHDKTGKGNLGMELYTAHDMRKLTKHWEWKIFGGMAINDIQASTIAHVNSTLNTVTDTYDLYGVTPPSAPYSSPSSTSINVVDSSGNTVTDSSGNTVTQSVDSSVLISAAPIASNLPTGGVNTADTTSALEQFKLHGAYVTFRVGPQLMYDFNDHLKLSLSAGPVLIFAGSTYQVNAVLTPPTGAQIVDTVTNTTNRLLPGYYVDATLQYDLTDRTGFYFGAFDQSAGNYLQTATSPNGGAYTTKVDFDNQNGVRTGLSYKF